MSASQTREQIVTIADRLFYERGYEATSFTDIAQDAGLSRGNFYYHFKTKDDILKAVVEHRLAVTGAMLHAWEQEAGTPAGRITCFVNMLIANQPKIKAHGCPVGTLATELAKLGHPAGEDVRRLFELFHVWLARQFTAMGRADDADALAMHILMRSQGIATLAAALKDEAFLHREVDDMAAWLRAQQPSIQ